MKLSQLNGPLRLTALNVDRAVQKNRAGVYVLGYEVPGGFHVERLGRSDRDLNSEVRKNVGKFASFKAAYCNSPEEAYDVECHLWHDFANRQQNPRHPAPPEGMSRPCPRDKQCLVQNAVLSARGVPSPLPVKK